MDFNNILNNPNNIYFGHGTGTEENLVVESIMNNGLRCSHGSLYYTSEVLGIGSQIQENEQEKLRNWPHKESKIVVIVSLPLQYKIIDIAGSGTYNQGDAAYYYTPNEEVRKAHSLTNSPYVMPEFIIGYYDSRVDSFTPNSRYYENLSQDEQARLFNQVKENYFNIVDEGWGIEQYKEIAQELGWSFGLTDAEVAKFKRHKEEQDLLAQISPEVLDKKLMLPTGNEISARQYIQTLVLPYIPTSGFITLNNGSQIPVLHFILECVIYDCQNRYNGDFAKYLQDNVQMKALDESQDMGTR